MTMTCLKVRTQYFACFEGSLVMFTMHAVECIEAYKWYRRYRKAETQARVAPPPTDSEVVEESPELIDDGFMSEMFDDSVYTKAAENGEAIPVCY